MLQSFSTIPSYFPPCSLPPSPIAVYSFLGRPPPELALTHETAIELNQNAEGGEPRARLKIDDRTMWWC